MNVDTADPGIPEGFIPYDGASNPFQIALGPLFIRRGVDITEFAFLPAAHHSNGRSVHGGVLLALADQVLGLTLRENYGPSATVTLNCDLASAGNVGEWVFGSGELIRETKTLLFVRGRLWSDDRTILTASGIWKRLKSVPPAA